MPATSDTSRSDEPGPAAAFVPESRSLRTLRGALLAQALEGAGIDRGAVYLTNAVKHFKWRPRGKRRLHQTPRAGEVEACKPWLEAELEAVRPSAADRGPAPGRRGDGAHPILTTPEVGQSRIGFDAPDTTVRARPRRVSVTGTPATKGRDGNSRQAHR